MLKVKKITIENFRGIKLPVSVDFEKGGKSTSAIIYGRNGTGKSSIVDAWEWLINFDIKELAKEGISAKDFPHKSSNGVNSLIKVEFSHQTITSVEAKFNKSKITTPTTTGDYAGFKAYTVYPNYLRYSDLQEFVYKTKTDKYKYIARFFGLEKFTKNQADLQATITRLSTQLESLETELKESVEKIKEIIGGDSVDEAMVIAFINSIAAKYKIDQIAEFKQAVLVKKALDEIVNNNPVAKALTEWKQFQARLFKFYPLGEVVEDAKAVEKAFKELKKDEANITKLILIELYESAKETLQQLADKTKCPVCDQKFNGNLLNHVTEKHKALAELNKKKADFDTKKSALEKKLNLISAKVTGIQSEEGAVVLKAMKPFFDQVKEIGNGLTDIIAIVKKPLKDLPTFSISSEASIQSIDTLSAEEAKIKKKVADTIKELEEDKKSKDLAKNYTNIVNLITAYTEFLVDSKKVDYLKKIVDDLSALFDHLTAYIQTQIQNTFSSIQADLVDCYNVLEDSNPFLKNPEIKLVTGKDKAVELEIEFVSEKVTPAYKFMSESQVNSFGLAIFLAAAKHFNSKFKFIILDDVVSSFDAFKRPKVPKLLASKFSDFQILILTHDNIFFDTVQRGFPQWQRYKFTAWDYTTGPKFKLSKNYAEEIQAFIDDDSPILAGQTLGRYLEWIFGMVNENMQTPLRYKSENVYTLAEFYDPLVKRFKDKLKQSGKTHNLTQAFDQFEQGTIFRNYCAHWKDEPTPFTAPEIETIFKKWIEIEKMLFCDTCKSFVSFDSSTGTEYVRCDCATLDLKNASYYS